METFFLDDKNGSEDEEYQHVRDRRNHRCASAHDLIEEMWPLCSEFLDPDIRQKARKEFHQRWWELYLTHSLLGASVQLVRREHQETKNGGPDLLSRVAGENLWIEAVAPTAGTGADAVRSCGPPKAPKPIPDREIMLRFQQAFSAKVVAYEKYIKKGWISPSDGYVIALNGALPEKGYPCLQRFPRVVSALLLGLETERVVVEFDETSSRIGESLYDYQTENKKNSSAPVDLAALRDSSNSCVSAVLYSASYAYSCSAINNVKTGGSDVMAREFVLVLNPHAKVSLAPSFLPAIPRYWVVLQDDGLVLHLPPHGD